VIRRAGYPLIASALTGVILVVSLYLFFERLWPEQWPEYVADVAPLLCAFWAGRMAGSGLLLGALIGSSAVVVAIAAEIMTAGILLGAGGIDWTYLWTHDGIVVVAGALLGSVGASTVRAKTRDTRGI
jgi:hypothetical protein